MFKIDYATQEIKLMRMIDVAVGTAFTSTFRGKKELFLKNYDGVVSLEDPQNTWKRQNETILIGYQQVQLSIKVSTL